ncbi:sensor histidine kinase [Croceitalea vernalis]|uniref:histidine kinase n=1 Tax=Croceitalea vernalis TaxID=3075599 RepID=A0ABU3BG33_9FLAO|nr:ATP-binding protein [Croceitalea sp. P007]MDT0621100.1 ATP-binding protein [Croceitalea sp. P007]
MLSIKKKTNLNYVLKVVHLISALGALLVFFITITSYPQRLRIFILSVAGLYLLPVFIKYNSFSKFYSIYNAFIIPLWFAMAIFLFGGYFAQALASLTSIFISHLLMRKTPKLRKWAFFVQISLFVLPTIYVNLYGPLFEEINIPFDELVVYFCCLIWLSIIFVIYDEQKTKSFTRKLELKNDSLIELNKKLKDKNRQIKEFTDILHHDLQEPVRNISEFAKQILDKKEKTSKNSKSEINNQLEFIYQSSTRMGQLVNRVSEYVQIGVTQSKKNIDCNKLIREVLEDIALRIKETNTKINITVLPKIKGQETEIRMLFQNLILNAIKFSKTSLNPNIEISASNADSKFHFIVKDNGIGIPEHQLVQIFRPFFRLHSRDKYEGIGLGLHNCLRIIELHNGTIWAESKENKGTTIHFTIEK